MNTNNYFNALGQIAWLWSQSPLHKDWSTSLLARNVIPAIHHGQYVILIQNDYPIAYCSWANLNLENEAKYIQDVTSLTLEDWNSGDRKWFIDWVTPFGDTSLLYKYMREKFPYALFRAIRASQKKQGIGRIIHIQGGKVNKQQAREKFTVYYNELIEALKKSN